MEQERKLIFYFYRFSSIFRTFSFPR